MDNQTLLMDRLEVIRLANQKYDLENNAYISFSGGKDSTILHHLIDMALPNNKIPRVYSNTGIEYVDIVSFVKELAVKDERFTILTPKRDIKQTLEEVGYPFKSKLHSHMLEVYRNNIDVCDKYLKEVEDNPSLLKDLDYIHNLPTGAKTVVKYLYGIRERERELYIYGACPKSLIYQFTKEYPVKVSDKCCFEFKKKPFKAYEKENKRSVIITGMRQEEGGNRSLIENCILLNDDGSIHKFHPLLKVDNDWEDWFVKEFNVQLSKLYYPPFNFVRTGCKGCPYSLHLQEQIDVMEKLLPNEKAQCELIWQPIYDDYRKHNYRLKNEIKLF